MAPSPTTDEWIIGDGIDGARRYVLHSRHPRFIACVIEIDPDTRTAHEPHTDVHAESLVYRADLDLALGDLQWIDPAPAGRDLTRLMEAACDAVERWERGR